MYEKSLNIIELLSKVGALSPENSNVNELEFMFRNAIDIISSNVTLKQEILHTYNKDVKSAKFGTVNSERIKAFKDSQKHFKLSLSADISIVTDLNIEFTTPLLSNDNN
jgi:hypothetical protein